MTKFKHTKENQEAVVRSMAGLPQKPYTRGDIAQAFVDGFHYRDPLTTEQLDIAIDYLNNHGHNEENFNYIVNSFATPQYTYKKYNPIQLNAERFPREVGRVFRFIGNTLDVPRRAVASFINNSNKNKENNIDDRYHPAHILDVMDDRPTPTLGVTFAQNHPVVSGVVDVGTNAAAWGGLTSLIGLGENAFNEAVLSRQVTGPQKTNVLRDITSGTMPNTVGYQVIKRLVPRISSGSQSNTVITTIPTKVKSLTGRAGTNSSRTGWQQSSRPINYGYVRSNYTKTPFLQAQTDVTTWPVSPIAPFFMPGVPQIVPPIQSDSIVVDIPQETIHEDIPVSVTNSDIVNWYIKNKGLKEGDTITNFPGVGDFRYIRGNGGLGNRYKFGVHKEYDAHDKDPKQQPNVPDRTNITSGDRTGVRKIQGRNPEYMYRNPNDWFPYIVE